MENNTPNQGLPLTFMFDGFIYSKEMDGCYHKFQSNCPRIKANSLEIISISQAKYMLSHSKFISSIIVITNDVNLKI